MSRQINAVLVTGERRAGSTTFAKFLSSLLSSKNSKGLLVHTDIEDMIDWYRHFHGPLGQEVKKYVDAKNPLPQDILRKMFIDWFQHLLAGNPKLETIIVSGLLPVTDEVMLAYTHEFGLSRATVIHLVDSKGLPQSANSNTVGITLWLDRSVPLTAKLEKALRHFQTVDHTPVPKHIAVRGLNRLRAGNHPIHQKIRIAEKSGASETLGAAPQPAQVGPPMAFLGKGPFAAPA